jgi:hypothetical protein
VAWRGAALQGAFEEVEESIFNNGLTDPDVSEAIGKRFETGDMVGLIGWGLLLVRTHALTHSLTHSLSRTHALIHALLHAISHRCSAAPLLCRRAFCLTRCYPDATAASATDFCDCDFYV